MFRIVQFKTSDNKQYKLLCESDDGNYTAQGILGMIGVSDEALTADDKNTWKLMALTGTIGEYQTHLFGLFTDNDTSCEDCTDLVAGYLGLPSTAVKSMLSRIDADVSEVISSIMEDIRYYETVTSETKVYIPKEMMTELAPGIADKMSSIRHSFVLKNTENQEIFQENCTADFGFVLPSLTAIHNNGSKVASSNELLRIIAPYRKEERSGVYSYKSIYHTPYYKVDMKLRGLVPSYLSWITGYSSNDSLEIQPNERHMYNNLKTLLYADLSRYTSEIATGIFLSGKLGSLLSKFCRKMSDNEAIRMLYSDIKTAATEDCYCDITVSEVENLINQGWVASDVADTVKSKLVLAPGYLSSLVNNRPQNLRMVDCDNLPFVLNISDEESQKFLDSYIKMGYITGAFCRYLIELCKCAYRVNWGHTGAARAIHGFVDVSEMDNLDAEISGYLKDKAAKILVPVEKYSTLFYGVMDTDDDEFDYDDDSGSEDELLSSLDYYITNETAQRISMNSLASDFFTTQASTVQSSEAAIVEYWRVINGDNNLDTFLFSCLLQTSDPDILIEAFIKLLRWGERKPQLLVFMTHPEIRYVFDLNAGQRIDNTTVVDERELVKKYGCDYSLVGILSSESNSSINPQYIVGFVLQKDYGKVQKRYLASWLDLGEKLINSNTDVGEFSTLVPFTLDPQYFIPVEKFEKESYNLYVSDSNIELGLRNKIQAKDLNALALLTTPGIMDSAGYLRSLKDDSIITVRDRQFDILRRYVASLNDYYKSVGYKLNAVSNTMELGDCIREFWELASQHSEEKVTANEKAAASAMQKLNLDNSTPNINWDTSELKGTFLIICDMKMQSSIPPINFTDPSLQQLAARVQNRIVLLLLQLPDKYVFCRKDIRQHEVARVTRVDQTTGQKVLKIGRKDYSDFSSALAHLTQGRSCSINKKPVVLHESLKGILG